MTNPNHIPTKITVLEIDITNGSAVVEFSSEQHHLFVTATQGDPVDVGILFAIECTGPFPTMRGLRYVDCVNTLTAEYGFSKGDAESTVLLAEAACQDDLD